MVPRLWCSLDARRALAAPVYGASSILRIGHQRGATVANESPIAVVLTAGFDTTHDLEAVGEEKLPVLKGTSHSALVPCTVGWDVSLTYATNPRERGKSDGFVLHCLTMQLSFTMSDMRL